MTINLSKSNSVVLKDANSLFVASLAKKIFYNYVGYFQALIDEASVSISKGKVHTPWAVKILKR